MVRPAITVIMIAFCVYALLYDNVQIVRYLLLEVCDRLLTGLVAGCVLTGLISPILVDRLVVLCQVSALCILVCGNKCVKHILSTKEFNGTVGLTHNRAACNRVLRAAFAIQCTVRPLILQTILRAVQRDPIDDLAYCFRLLRILICKNPCATPEETDGRCAHCPIAICAFAEFFAAAVRSHGVVDQPSGTEETKDTLLSFTLHVRKPCVLPVLCIIVIAVVL